MTDASHNEEKEALEDAINRVLSGVGKVSITRHDDWVTHDDGTVSGPGYSVGFQAAETVPVPDPVPDPTPTPDPTPVPDPVPTAPTIVSQELTPSKYQVMVGESFTVSGLLLMSDGTSKPVSAYRLYKFDTKLLKQVNIKSVPWFTALAEGTTSIANDNSGTTGRTSVTIVANDGTVFPPPTAPVTPPSDPTDPTSPPADNPTGPVGTAGLPAPSVIDLPVPVSPVGTGPHLARPEVKDGAGRVWFAEGHTGDDPRHSPGMPARFVNEAGEAHPILMATFYDDGCHVHVARMDSAYDLTGCFLSMTYDGEPVPVPPSSYADGTYAFWKSCWGPTIRYGKQIEFADLLPIDWSVLPSFTKQQQTVYSDAKADYTWNGQGIATTPAMGTTGERGDIGFIMQAMMSFLLNPTAETWAVVRRADDWAGNWPVYPCEPSTGRIINFNAYQMATTLPPVQSAAWQNKNPIAGYKGSLNGDTLTPPKDGWKNTGSRYVPNGAHLQGFGKVSAMVTGTVHDRDNLSFWANWTMLEINPVYTRAGGCALGAQRRFAWCLGMLFVAAYHSSDPEYFLAEVKRNIAIANAFPKNDFGLYDPDVAYKGKGEAYKYTGLARWMLSYLAITFDAVSFKLPEAIPFAQYLGKHEALCAQFPFYLARTIYTFICYGPDGKMLTDFKEMTKLSLCDNGYALEDAEAMVNATTVEEAYAARVANATRSGKTANGLCVNGVADFLGNPASPDSYPAGAEAAVMAAANAGTPGIGKAVAYVLNVPTKPAYTKNQKYHLELRIPV